MIDSREYSILLRIAMFVVIDYRSHRLDMAVEKLRGDCAKKVAQNVLKYPERGCKVSNQLIVAAAGRMSLPMENFDEYKN